MKQLLVALAAFTSRLNLFPANITALGSYGFFGNPVLFAVSIVLFDRFVGGWYGGFWLTYVGFAMYPLMGWLAKKKPQLSWILLPTASFLFYFFSNLGSWYYWYPRTVEGFLLCYALAVPFYARTLLGDLSFGYGYLLWQNGTLKKAITAISVGIFGQSKITIPNN